MQKKMTLKRLNNIFNLKREVEYYKRKLLEIRKSLGDLSAVTLSDEPSGGSLLSIQERAIERLEKFESLYAESLKKYENELLETTTFINNIDDSRLRRIFTLRFIDGKSWQRVAFELDDGRNTSSSVRMACIRFLEN